MQERFFQAADLFEHRVESIIHFKRKECFGGTLAGLERILNHPSTTEVEELFVPLVGCPWFLSGSGHESAPTARFFKRLHEVLLCLQPQAHNFLRIGRGHGKIEAWHVFRALAYGPQNSFRVEYLSRNIASNVDLFGSQNWYSLPWPIWTNLFSVWFRSP